MQHQTPQAHELATWFAGVKQHQVSRGTGINLDQLTKVINSTVQRIDEGSARMLDTLAEQDELQTMLDIANLEQAFTFDIHTIYCQKTGQPIGKRDRRTLEIFTRVYDPKRAIDFFEYVLHSSCAAHWIKTDGWSLDRLMIQDPCGYFVYAASRALRHHYKSYAYDKGVFRDPKEFMEYTLNQIRLYQYAEGLDTATIHQANIYLRFFNVFSPRVLNTDVKSFRDFMRFDIDEHLETQVMLAIAKYLDAEKSLAYHKAFAALERLRGNGASNFKAQRPRTFNNVSDEIQGMLISAGLTVIEGEMLDLRQFDLDDLEKITDAAITNDFNISVTRLGDLEIPDMEIDTPTRPTRLQFNAGIRPQTQKPTPPKMKPLTMANVHSAKNVDFKCLAWGKK